METSHRGGVGPDGCWGPSTARALGVAAALGMGGVWAMAQAADAGASVGAATEASLTVEVEGARNDTGAVGCLAFRTADGFPRETAKAAARVWAKLEKGKARCVFSGLGAGPVAISAMHDENGNGKLDANFLGIPTEGYAASRDAKAGVFGPPKFEAARLELDGQPLTLVVHLVY